MSSDTRPATAAARADGPDSTSDTMSAIAQDGYGSAEVLRLETVPRPVAGGRDVLVRVAAAGLDRGVRHAMTGLPYLGRLYFGIRRPTEPVLGTFVAGTVVALGPDVTGFSVGDEVFGFGRGAFAEYALVADDRLAHKPGNLSFAAAANPAGLRGDRAAGRP